MRKLVLSVFIATLCGCGGSSSDNSQAIVSDDQATSVDNSDTSDTVAQTQQETTTTPSPEPVTPVADTSVETPQVETPEPAVVTEPVTPVVAMPEPESTPQPVEEFILIPISFIDERLTCRFIDTGAIFQFLTMDPDGRMVLNEVGRTGRPGFWTREDNQISFAGVNARADSFEIREDGLFADNIGCTVEPEPEVEIITASCEVTPGDAPVLFDLASNRNVTLTRPNWAIANILGSPINCQTEVLHNNCRQNDPPTAPFWSNRDCFDSGSFFAEEITFFSTGVVERVNTSGNFFQAGTWSLEDGLITSDLDIPVTSVLIEKDPIGLSVPGFAIHNVESAVNGNSVERILCFGAEPTAITVCPVMSADIQ